MTTPSSPAPRAPAEGQMATVEHQDGTVAVAMLDGALHAFDDTCPHAGCSLAEGDLDGETVVCPCHQATFDVTTGAVVDGPAPAGIVVWSVAVDDGELRVTPPPDAEPDQPAALEITALVVQEHEVIRAQFDALAALTDTAAQAAAWQGLAALLEVHASAEEAVLYPRLARAAAGEGTAEAVHAVRDHNSIRDSVRAVDRADVGSADWQAALDAARTVNEEHLQEEETDALPLFRDSTDAARREELGREWNAFHEQHQRAQGLDRDDVDPSSVAPG